MESLGVIRRVFLVTEYHLKQFNPPWLLQYDLGDFVIYGYRIGILQRPKVITDFDGIYGNKTGSIFKDNFSHSACLLTFLYSFYRHVAPYLVHYFPAELSAHQKHLH